MVFKFLQHRQIKYMPRPSGLKEKANLLHKSALNMLWHVLRQIYLHLYLFPANTMALFNRS